MRGASLILGGVALLITGTAVYGAIALILLGMFWPQ